VVSHDNAPGDAVWIPMQEPHWVDAGTFSATLTFVINDLRWCDEPAPAPAVDAPLITSR
jgi:hypothetical protein